MRKWMKVSAIAVCLAVVLSGCGGYNKDGGSETKGNETVKEGSDNPSEGSKDGVLIVGLDSDLQTLDPGHGYEVYGNMIYYALYDYLYKVYEDSTPVPSLVVDSQIDETQTVYTMKIKEDVVFSSGNPLTTKDVAFTANRTKNLKGNSSHTVGNVESIETPDDYTIVFTLKEPDASFLVKLANNSFAILDSEVVKEHGGTDAEDASTTDTAQDWLNKNSAGSGAYVLEKWTPNVQVVMDRNDKYWGEVKNERVICNEIPDVNTQIQTLLQGDLDIALSIGVDNVSQLEGKDGVTVTNTPAATISFLLMNQDPAIGGPMADTKVQQAVRYAINYKELLQISGDSSLLPLNIVPKGFTGALERDENSTDLEKAKELMAEAGYADGFDITFTVADYDSEGMSWTTLGQKVKDDLSKIGINAQIKTGDIGTIIDSYREGKEPFLLMHWHPDYPDINNQLVFLPGGTVGERANWTEWPNSELEDLMNTIISEADEAKRTEASEKLQQILSEDMPYAFLVQHPKVLAHRSNLEGVKYYEIQKINFQDITIK